jgi:hypothetical protein
MSPWKLENFDVQKIRMDTPLGVRGVKNEHKLKKYVLTSEHGTMVVFLALAYFRAQELKVCFHRNSGLSIVCVATTVGRTTVDIQCVSFTLNAGKLNAGGEKIQI